MTKKISDEKRAYLYKAAVELAGALRSGDILVEDLPKDTLEKLRALVAPQRAPMVHVLKCWPEPFKAIRDGRKRFEIRKNDRDFRPGDRLVLQEWEPVTGEYLGAGVEADVTYMVFGGQCGIPDDLCVMSLGSIVEQRVE